MKLKEYRIIETYGHYFNKRWSLQQKYSYYENSKYKESWQNECNGTKKFCEEALKRRLDKDSKYE